MHTSLRKMGNSTGLIVPRAMLGEIGVTTGAQMDLRVEGGRLIATPVTAIRAGWAAAAAAIADEPLDNDWLDVPNEGDAALEW